MKKVILFSLIVAIFSACSLHHIGYDEKNKLSISLDNKTVVKEYGDIVYKNQINLSQLQIEQKVFVMKNGRVLTYEEV